MEKLSFEFKYFWIKFLAIFISISVNLFLIVNMILALIKWNFKVLIVPVIVCIIYLIVSVIYNYLLYRSVTIKYDDQNLIIFNRNLISQTIPIKSIVKIKRTFFHFYRITYKLDINTDSKLYFYISPNPPLTKPAMVKKFKEANCL